MGTIRKPALIDDLWREKMHTDPQALDGSPPAVRMAYKSIWAPAERMRHELRVFPAGLLSLWLNSPRGHMIFTHRPSRYVAGIQVWRGRSLDSICFISVGDLISNRKAVWIAFSDLMNHLMGSDGIQDGAWFSDGTAMSETLQDIALRFVRIHALGYGHDELGASTAREYLSQTLALFITDPDRLHILDPLIYRLYHKGLMDEASWSKA